MNQLVPVCTRRIWLALAGVGCWSVPVVVSFVTTLDGATAAVMSWREAFVVS